VPPRKEVIWGKLEKSETRKRKTRKIKGRRWAQRINLGMILREIHLQVGRSKTFEAQQLLIEMCIKKAEPFLALPFYSDLSARRDQEGRIRSLCGLVHLYELIR